ncbi:MAG TPA: hypothetical protein VN673_11705 [Clostridia bacterium]|nr:hypothetical protein [Clostridia bacterium]
MSTNYMKDGKVKLNVADTTEVLEMDEGCAKQFKLSQTTSSASVVHKLNNDIASDLEIVLVAADQQRTRIEEKRREGSS